MCRSVLNEAEKRRVKKAAHVQSQFVVKGMTKEGMNERKLGSAEEAGT
jgi:hypothetical protein